MNRIRRPHLRLEALESRLCPALTMRLLSSYLMISGTPTGDLAVTETAPNTFHVTDAGKNIGTYSGVSNIYMTLASHKDKRVDFDFGGFRLGGNLLIKEGLGIHTSPGLTGTGIRNGSIGGSVTILGGSGDEEVNLGTDSKGLNPAPLRVGGDVTFAPHVNAQIPLGGGGFLLNTFDSQGKGAAPTVTIGGSVTLYNVAQVALGTATTVGHDVNVSAGVGQPENFFDFATIGRNLSISSIGSSAMVNLGLVGFANTTIQGNVSASLLGSGNDTFSFAAGSTINGNGNITTGAGNDSVNLDGTVGGSLSLNTGEGNDTVTTAAAGAVAGNLSITEGSGNDSATVDGRVSGNLNFNLGNGNDTVTIGNAPSGTLNWRSGNGNDSVTFGDATNAPSTWNVFMQFGTGNDTLTLAGNGTVATPNALTGFVDMGGPPGGNSFDPTGSTAAGTWIIVQPFTLQNV